MRRVHRGTAAATALLLAASVVTATAAQADPTDPVYEATLSVEDAGLYCQNWPVFDDGEWTTAEGAGPATDSFRFATTIGNFDENFDVGDYRIILTYGNPGMDGVGYSIGGFGAGPHNDGVENPDGSVTANWDLDLGAVDGGIPSSIGIQMIGYSATDQWVQIYGGTIPVTNSCNPPTQQIGAPDWLTLGDDGVLLAGRTGRVEAGLTGNFRERWVCACNLAFTMKLTIDGEEVYSGTNPYETGLLIPPGSEGKTAVVTISASADPAYPNASLWTPVSISSDPIVISAPPPLSGKLHFHAADPGWNFDWGSEVLCAAPVYPMVGTKIWASPLYGKYMKNGPTTQCGALLDLTTDTYSTPQGSVTWYDTGGQLIGTGNPLTVTADMCGDVITARQTWTHVPYPSSSPAEISGTLDYPVFCIQTMTPVKPVVTGTARVGSPLTATVTGWLPANATFTYQWYLEVDSTGTNRPIAGATNKTFTPTLSEAGHRIWVNVVGTASGYYGADRLSDPVKIPVSVPSAPRSLKATAKSQSVALTWTAPAANGGGSITGYKVLRSTNGTSWTTIKTTTSRSYTATGLTNGKKYWFRVVATNSAGTSPASASVTAVPATKPSAPRSLKSTAKTKSVALSWTAPSSTGGSAVTGYRIYRSTNGSSFSYVKTTTSRSITLTGLTKGKKYWFRVTAVNTMGASSASNTVSATPK